MSLVAGWYWVNQYPCYIEDDKNDNYPVYVKRSYYEKHMEPKEKQYGYTIWDRTQVLEDDDFYRLCDKLRRDYESRQNTRN